jgi:exodeoxyribonuclease VII large subunit
MEQILLDLGPERRVFTVSELTAAIRKTLDREFSAIWVAGEISGVKLAASGHCYFTLKDSTAQVRCVCFKSSMRYLKFKPQDGVAVVARGSLDVYEARGEYQLIVETLEPQGYGALQFAFEQLKKRLAAEGLFEAERKRKLPRYPARIGIVTSPRGAVIADMINIFSRRFPGLHIRLFPALVQGAGSVEEVTHGIEHFSREGWAEVIIVARGGGSLEDLWTFNEEAVARAIAASAIPVVSAVGHETDVTIADFVADLRAPTPSAAAELIVRNRRELLDQILAFRGRLAQAVRFRLASLGRRLEERGVARELAILNRTIGRNFQRVDESLYRLRSRMAALLASLRRRRQSLEDRVRYFDPRPRFARDHRRLDTARAAAVHAMRLQLSRRRGMVDALEGKLSQLSPLRILERGYAIVTDGRGEIVKRAAAAPADSRVQVRLAEGRLRARVEKSED